MRLKLLVLLLVVLMLFVNFSSIGQDLLPLPSNPRVNVSGELQRWHRVTLTFNGPEVSETSTPNPFTDYRLNVTFSNGSKTYVVPGFYAADGNAAETSATGGSAWRVHFTPDEIGEWSYTASFRTGSNIAISFDANVGTPTGFDGESGTFQVVESTKTAPDFRAKGRLQYVGDHYMRFAGNGEYYLKNGADSPENFLAYYEFDGTYDTGGIISNFIHRYPIHASDWKEGDPVWQGTKGKNIIGALNYLNSQRVNSVYFLTYNIDGGDGSDTWMWTSHTERYRFDVSKLEQWEIVLNHMNKLGLMLHIVTQEQENDELLGGNSGLNDVRKLYYRELVARFSHHLAITWNLGEENNNTDQERLQFSDYIRALDPYDHPTTVHTGYNEEYFYYDSLVGSLEATSLQGDAIYYNEWAIKWRNLSANAGRKWAIYGDEQGPRVSKNMSNVNQLVRDAMWGNLMGGGAGVEWYFGYQSDFGDLQSEDWRIAEPLWQRADKAVSFFQTYLPFWQMQPDNNLASGDALVLAKLGEVYAVYLPTGTSSGIKQLNITSGTYTVRWYNPATGGPLQTGSIATISGSGFKSLGNPPSNSTQDWAALVQRVDPNVTPTPTPETPTATPVPPTSTPATQSVVRLVLVDAVTDQDIAELTEGYVINFAQIGTNKLNIRAETNPAVVGSVVFGYDSNAKFSTQTDAPYAFKGDVNGDYYSWTPTLGNHKVVATPYSKSGGTGTIGTPLTVNFTVINNAIIPTSTPNGTVTNTPTPTVTNTLPAGQSVVRMVLVNAVTDKDIAVLTEGYVINFAQIGTNKLNIRAETNPAVVGSVVFGYDSNAKFSTQTDAPYTFKGDVNGDYYSWTPTLGNHKVVATPYSKSGGTGTIGASLTINFSVVNSTAPAPQQMELIENGGFDALSDERTTLVWNEKHLSKDRLVCGSDGNCGFRFKGTPGEKAKLTQPLEAGMIGAGDTLSLSATVNGKRVVEGGRIAVEITYLDGTTDKLRLNVPTGSYADTGLTNNLTVQSTVSAVKVQIRYKGEQGQFTVDNISLTVDKAGMAILPLP
jgi:hypothetical protein